MRPCIFEANGLKKLFGNPAFHLPITAARLISIRAHNALIYQSQMPGNCCFTSNGYFVTPFKTTLYQTFKYPNYFIQYL